MCAAKARGAESRSSASLTGSYYKRLHKTGRFGQSAIAIAFRFPELAGRAGPGSARGTNKPAQCYFF